MEILIWLAVPLGVTVLAMLWALWAGRAERDGDARGTGRRSSRRDAAYDRFSTAVQRPVPERARNVATQPGERPTGVAVRPSQRTAPPASPGTSRPSAQWPAR